MARKRHTAEEVVNKLRLAEVELGKGNVGVRTLHIESASLWENGHVESFNGKLRDELLNGDFLHTVMEAKVLIEQWRSEYNTIRPHSSLGYRPPAPSAIAGSSTQHAAVEACPTALRSPPPRV